MVFGARDYLHCTSPYSSKYTLMFMYMCYSHYNVDHILILIRSVVVLRKMFVFWHSVFAILAASIYTGFIPFLITLISSTRRTSRTIICIWCNPRDITSIRAHSFNPNLDYYKIVCTEVPNLTLFSHIEIFQLVYYLVYCFFLIILFSLSKGCFQKCKIFKKIVV